MKLFGSLVVALAVVIALGLPTMAQLAAPAAPSGGKVDGGSPGPGQTFVAVAFEITNGATADTLRDILFSNSPASSPAAVGTDVAQIQLFVRTLAGACVDGDFDTTAGDNGLNDAHWTLLQTIPGPLGAGFNTALPGGGLAFTGLNLAFGSGDTRCFAILIQVSSGAVAGRKFGLEVAARKGDLSVTSATTVNGFDNTISFGPSLADQATSLTTVSSGATNQVIQIIQIIDTERGTNATAAARNLDPDGNPIVITSVTVVNTATTPADNTDISAAKLFYLPLSGGASCPGATAAGNPPVGAIQVAILTGSALANFATSGITFSGLNLPAVDEAKSANNNMGCLYVVVDVTSTPGRNFRTTTGVSGSEGTLGSFTISPGVNATTTRQILGAANAGCDALTPVAGIGPATIAAGTTGFDSNSLDARVMEFDCQDLDPDANDVTINSLVITNLGTATPSDISRIAVYRCAGATCAAGDIVLARRAGFATVSSFPVTITLTANNTVADNTTRRFAIVVDVTSTIGNTIQLSISNVNVTEGGVPTTHAGPFDDDTPSTITGGANRGCEDVTDLNVDAGSIPSGTSAIVQRLVCADSDGIADSNTVLITQVNVRNLGNAVGGPSGDVSKIEIVRMDTNAVVGSTTNTANFATTGVNIPVSVTVPDDGSVELGVRVYVTGTPGRTIQLRTTLRMFEGGVGPFLKSADDGTPETIAAPAACPTVVQGAPAVGQIGVFQATPATLTFTNAGPDGTGQLRTIRVRVQNRSSIDITVEDITEQLGEIVVVEGVTPILPRTVRKNTSVTFFVKVRGPDVGPFPQTATRPYVDVTINCGGPTAMQPARKLALPLEVKEIRAEQRGELLSFRVLGSGVQELGVQLFSLSGQLIADHRTSGATLTVPALTAQGQRLAKGVYLYVVTVRGWDGQVIRSEIRKIVVK
jgi:hypothetical protein